MVWFESSGPPTFQNEPAVDGKDRYNDAAVSTPKCEVIVFWRLVDRRVFSRTRFEMLLSVELLGIAISLAGAAILGQCRLKVPVPKEAPMFRQ
jgi:hypothetical protein